MRNKDLMEQNFSLFEQLQKAQHDIEILKQELIDCKNDIAALKNGGTVKETILNEEVVEQAVALDEHEEQEEVVLESAEETKEEPEETLPIALGVNINNPNAEYGSEAIGEIVVKSSFYASENPQAANLIFGKTEMAKSEILSIMSSEISSQQKKDEIDIVLQQAEEYFKSLA